MYDTMLLMHCCIYTYIYILNQIISGISLFLSFLFGGTGIDITLYPYIYIHIKFEWASHDMHLKDIVHIEYQTQNI